MKDFKTIKRDCDEKMNICGNIECRKMRKIISGLHGCLCNEDNCHKLYSADSKTDNGT